MNKRNFQWAFGNNLGLNFNDPGNAQLVSSPPTKKDGQIYTLEGCASVCDPVTGDLIFSTDGEHIIDAAGNRVFSGLAGNPSATTSAIIAPSPGSATDFYIITSGEISGIEPLAYINNAYIDAGQATSFLSPSRAGLHFYHLDTAIPGWDLSDITSNIGSQFTDEMGSTITVDVENGITEKLCLVANSQCTGYWLLTGWGNIIITYEIDNNGIKPHTYFNIGEQVLSPVGYMKASHDGTRLAVANTAIPRIDLPNSLLLYDLDAASGKVSFPNAASVNLLSGNAMDPFPRRSPYGIEFSPDNQLLYCSLSGSHKNNDDGVILQIELTNNFNIREVSNNLNLSQNPNPTLLPSNKNTFAASLGITLPPKIIPHLAMGAGALLLGPDGVIYAARGGSSELAAILHPNEVEDGTNKCGLNNRYIDFTDPDEPQKVNFGGLPSLIQEVACDGSNPTGPTTCEEHKEQVNSILSQRCKDKHHTLEYCDPTNACDCDPTTQCEPAELPEYKPCISIRWGQSPCDGIESDDVEIMCITVCNCYSNLSFSNFHIAALTVVDANGNTVALLPDGSPSVEVVPIGPYHFGKIEPCSCVSREFVFRTRGAISGAYRIKLEGICYDVCLHYDTEDCFIVDMCAD